MTLAALRTEHPEATPEWQAIMAEGFLDHAQQLRREIEEYTGASVVEDAELWLSLKGRDIGEGEGPTSVLTAILDAFRKGVQSVAEFLASGLLARRPTAAL